MQNSRILRKEGNPWWGLGGVGIIFYMLFHPSRRHGSQRHQRAPLLPAVTHFSIAHLRKFSYSCKRLHFCCCNLILSPSLCFSCTVCTMCLKKILIETLPSNLKRHSSLFFFSLAQVLSNLLAATSRPTAVTHKHCQKMTTGGHFKPCALRDQSSLGHDEGPELV